MFHLQFNCFKLELFYPSTNQTIEIRSLTIMTCLIDFKERQVSVPDYLPIVQNAYSVPIILFLAIEFLNCVGVNPLTFLKVALNEDLELKPTSGAIPKRV